MMQKLELTNGISYF